MNAPSAARKPRLRMMTTAASAGAWLLTLCSSWPAVAAESPELPTESSVEVQALRPNLHVLSGAGANIVVWSGEDGTVMVDSGLRSASVAVFEAVARVAPGRLRFVINTNDHPDHTGGNAFAIGIGAIVVDHEGLRPQSAREAASPAAAHPLGPEFSLTTDHSVTLQLNGDSIDIVQVANAHTRGNLVVRWTEADIVHLGDIYWNGQYPVVDVAAGGSLAGMVAAIEGTLSRTTEHTTFVPGHGAASGRAELEAYRDMLVGVGRKVREAIEQGKELDEILALHPTADFDGRFGEGALTPEEFVRTVHRDLTGPRPAR